jgi:hypothetical protein
MPRHRVLDVALCAACCGALAGAQAPSALFRAVEEHVPHDFRPLLALDVDVDGDLDLVAREGVALNDGSGRFAPTSVAAPLASLLFFAVGYVDADLDGDGDRDLLVTAPNGTFTGAIAAYASTPAGLAPMAIALPPAAPGMLVRYDYDGDSFDDVLVAGPPSLFPPSGLQLWTNAGGAALTPAAGAFPATGGAPSFLAAGDFDGDADTDAFEIDLQTGVVRFHLRDGPAFFDSTAPLPAGPFTLMHGTSGDFDGDGAADVAFRMTGGLGPFTTYYDVGARCVGGFPSTTFDLATGPSDGYVAFDLDGDGVLDRAVTVVSPPGAAPAAATLEIRTGVPGVDAADSRLLHSDPTGPAVRLAFDADGDGDRDLLCQRAIATPRILYRDQTGSLHEPRSDVFFAVRGPLTAPLTADVVVGDFDGDGDADLARFASATCAAAPFATLSNDGRGRFPPPPSDASACVVAQATAKALAADFDGDGRDDALRVVQTGTLSATLYLSLPGGGFSSTPVGTESNVVSDFTVHDDDLDGDPDLVLCLTAPNAFVRYRNVGGGAFVRVATPLPGTPSEICVADLDQDGIVEYVVATSLGTFAIAPATGAATLVAPGSYQRLDVGDFDGDGDADLLQDGTPFVRQADGQYVAQPPLPGFPQPNAGPPLPQGLFDADQDGVLDALAYGALWRGVAGAGFAAPETVPFPSIGLAQTPQVTFMPFYRVADFDRDGDPDLLDPTGRLLANLTRHLALGRPAAIGRTATLEGFGPPLQPLELFAAPVAFAANPIPLPGWGNLFLPPAAAIYVGAFSFGADGAFSLPLPVPDLPALVGLDVHWQAVLPVAGALTNAETTTILSL